MSKWSLSYAVFCFFGQDLYLQDDKQSKRGVDACKKHEDVSTDFEIKLKKRSALLALVITSLQSSSLVKRQYWVVPTRYVATKVIQVQHSFDFRMYLLSRLL